MSSQSFVLKMAIGHYGTHLHLWSVSKLTRLNHYLNGVFTLWQVMMNYITNTTAWRPHNESIKVSYFYCEEDHFVTSIFRASSSPRLRYIYVEVYIALISVHCVCFLTALTLSCYARNISCRGTDQYKRVSYWIFEKVSVKNTSSRNPPKVKGWFILLHPLVHYFNTLKH